MKPIDIEMLRSFIGYRNGLLICTAKTSPLSRTNIGDALGTVNNTGHLRVQLFGALYQVHRLIWALHYGDPGPVEVDHKNRNKTDNRIENLRLATRKENARNNNAIGYCWDKHAARYKAKIRVDGVSKHLGRFTTELAAATAYHQARLKYFGEFA